jgi:hypothetical protein
MIDFLAPDDRALLQKHGLDSFAALWNVPLTAVDEPNVKDDGWSRVFRLELEGIGFYLKRQSNYFTRSLQHPLGEPTLAREFRNIMRYQRLGIPSLQAAFYGESKVDGKHHAVLLTHALDDWGDLLGVLTDWPQMTAEVRQAIILACAKLIGHLHASGLRHGCLYPKHLFLRLQNGSWKGCLIDLEKTRRLWLSWRDQVRDLEAFLRNVAVWDDAEQELFLKLYLTASRSTGSVALWKDRLLRRRAAKGKSH